MDVFHLILGAIQWVGLLFLFPHEEMEVQRSYMCPGSSASKQQRSAHPHRCCSSVPLLPWDGQKPQFLSPLGGEDWSSLGRLDLGPIKVHIKLTFQQTSFLRQSVVDIADLWYSETKEKAGPLKWEWLILFGIKRTIILRTNRQISSAKLSVGVVLAALCHCEAWESNDRTQHRTHQACDPRTLGDGSGMWAHENKPADAARSSLKALCKRPHVSWVKTVWETLVRCTVSY